MRFMTVLSASLILAGVSFSADISREDLKKALDKNPDVLVEALRSKKRDLLLMVIQAQQEEQALRRKEEEDAERKELEEAFKNPLKPEVSEKTHIRGNKSAKYTLVEYSDFECPYCTRGLAVVEQLRQKYGADLRVVFKNKPLTIHRNAMPAAQYYEAVALQSPEKAWEFHDKLFANQNRLGEPLYKELAKSMGLNLKKLEADAAAPEIKARIEADIKEAESFGINGTPGYIINGIPLRGAYPVERFDEIIQRLASGK